MAERLKIVRTSLGLSQRELCKRLELSTSTWQTYESGRSLPGAQVLVQICKMGFDGHWLLTGQGEMQTSIETPATQAEPHTTAHDKASEQEIIQYLKAHNLGDYLLMGRGGNYRLLWNILKILQREGQKQNHPLNYQSLYAALQETEIDCQLADVIGACEVLEREGLVQKNDLEQIIPSKSALLMRSDLSSMAEALRHGALHTLVHDILPRFSHEETSGTLVHLYCTIPPHLVKTFINTTKESILERSHAMSEDDGIPVHLVLAISS